MGTHRTAWHFFFAILLRKRGPRWIEVRDEVPLSDEPHPLDYLLLRRVPEIPADDPGQTLRGLWPLLPPTTIAELKTIGRPYRPRNLDRLLGYLHLYFSADDGGDEPIAEAVAQPSDLAGLLLIPAKTPTVEQEIRDWGLVWNDLGGGYAQITGAPFRLFVAEIDVAAEGENDGVLRLFGHDREHPLGAKRFGAGQIETKKEARMTVHTLEDCEEVFESLLDLLRPEKRLEGLTPEKRLEGLTPEQVVRAVGPYRLLSAMPDEVLRALDADFIEKLPEPACSIIRKRLGR